MLLIHIIQEATLIATPEASGAEGLVTTVVLWLILLTEVVAAFLIGVGVLLTLARLGNILFKLKGEGYERARLTLARFLALGLEFQLAADILSTGIAPSWGQIGKLGAIAVIRTALNYFLAKEIKEEEQTTSNQVMKAEG